ncbi:hypothetical protein G9P44_004917 [Scheffersomyces stipitis]|nr:hypothetical protein G9P44_004917 [Scheffersomyces stipitis]
MLHSANFPINTNSWSRSTLFAFPTFYGVLHIKPSYKLYKLYEPLLRLRSTRLHKSSTSIFSANK